MDSISKANFSPLTHAASIGDDATVLFLLEMGADAEERDSQGRSALSLAVSNGHLKSASYLLEHKADPEAADSSGVSPLQLARRNNLAEAINLLAGSAAKVTSERPQNAIPKKTRPTGIKKRGRWSVLRTAMLYLAGAGLALSAFGLRNLFYNRSSQAVFDAIAVNNISQMSRLLTTGISPNVTDSDGKSALLYAANNGRTDIVRLLLKNHADPNLGTTDGIAALSRGGIDHLEILDALLESGADPNRTDSRGRSLLAYACETNGYTGLIELLLKYHAKPNVRGENGTPLASLIESEGNADPEAVSALLAAGADPNSADSASTPVLVWAAAKGSLPVIKLLLLAGAKLSSVDTLKRTALHTACRQLRADIVQVLLDHGADPNLKDAEGNTPAVLALSGTLDSPLEARESCARIVRLLASHGARLDSGSRFGVTPLQFLRDHNLGVGIGAFQNAGVR